MIGIKAWRFATVQHSRPRANQQRLSRRLQTGLDSLRRLSSSVSVLWTPPPPSLQPPRFKTPSTAFNLETNLTPCPSVCQPDYSISPRQLVSPSVSRRDAPGTALDITGSIPPVAILPPLWHHQRIIMCSTPPPQTRTRPLAGGRRRTTSPLAASLRRSNRVRDSSLLFFPLPLSRPQSSGMQIASDRAIASSISDKWSEIVRPGINGPAC